MTQQIRANFMTNHQLDYDLGPCSRVRNLWVSQRTVGLSGLQEAEQWLDTPILEGWRNLMLSRYSVGIHPRYVCCGIRESRVEGDREIWGPLRQLLIKVFGYEINNKVNKLIWRKD